MKKIYNLIIIALCLFIFAGLFNFTATATSESVVDVITALANGTYSSSSSYLKYKVGNYFNSKVTSACSPHTSSNGCPDKTCIYGNVTINGTKYSGSQCMGFAYDIFRIIYGERYGVTDIAATKITWDGVTDPATWIKNTVQPGDYIRFGGHSAIVVGTTSQYLRLYEANGYYSEYQTQPCRVTINANRSWSSVSTKISNIGGSLFIWRANANSSSSPSANDIWLLSPPDGVLSLRTGATTSATKICDIPGGKYITVTKYANDGKWDWGYTTYNGQSGWVCLYYASKHTTHSYGSWQTVTAATCTTAGSQKRTCGCGAVETKSVSALGHNYSSTYTVDKAATCTVAGSKSKHCTRCSATTSVTSIPPTGHTYGGWQTVTNATCTTAGSQKRTCACGAVETQSIPASGHSFGAWTTEKAATCTAEGKEYRKCSTCGNYSTRAVSALGHNYSSSFTIDKAATCTVAGSKSKHCTRCSATTEVTAIPATGHSYGSWQTVSAATCTATGSQKRWCTSCGNTEYRTISALGHNYSSSWTVDKAATCTTSGTKSHHCTRCEAKSDITTIPALEHSWSGWTVTKQATVDSTGLKVRKCTNSGCTSQESAVIAKLAADGHTHDFGEWFTETAATCTADGVQKRICSDCKDYETLSVSAKGHSFGEWSVEKNATCTEGGTQKRGCSTCSETETLSSPAIGHSFGEWTVKIEATAETEGSLERKCADCSETETQSTPKLNGSANTSSTASTDGNSSRPDVSDKDTSSAPQNKSDLTTVIVICSVAIGAILAALVVLVIIKKKK